MKKIWIYFSDPEKMWYPFHKKEYLEAYTWMIEEIEKNDILVYIVRGNSYLLNWNFKNWFRIESWKIVEINENIKVDLIFNRDDKNTIPYIDDCKVINHPEFDLLCVDKLKTFERFSEISPKTAYIHSYEECINYIKNFELKNDNILVLKKNFETEWRWIYIWGINWISEGLYDDWSNILFQEFIDSSVWIPWIVEWIHDIRITVVNKTPISSYIRVPMKGSYLANIAQWGSWKSIKLSDVPKELIEMIEKINENMWDYLPLLYSADFMNSKGWFKLVELNSRAWLQHPNWFEKYYEFNNAVAKMLIEAVKN